MTKQQGVYELVISSGYLLSVEKIDFTLISRRNCYLNLWKFEVQIFEFLRKFPKYKCYTTKCFCKMLVSRLNNNLITTLLRKKSLFLIISIDSPKLFKGMKFLKEKLSRHRLELNSYANLMVKS